MFLYTACPGLRARPTRLLHPSASFVRFRSARAPLHPLPLRGPYRHHWVAGRPGKGSLSARARRAAPGRRVRVVEGRAPRQQRQRARRGDVEPHGRCERAPKRPGHAAASALRGFQTRPGPRVTCAPPKRRSDGRCGEPPPPWRWKSPPPPQPSPPPAPSATSAEPTAVAASGAAAASAEPSSTTAAAAEPQALAAAPPAAAAAVAAAVVEDAPEPGKLNWVSCDHFSVGWARLRRARRRLVPCGGASRRRAERGFAAQHGTDADDREDPPSVTDLHAGEYMGAWRR